MDLDHESRANRFLGALHGLQGLFANAVPDLPTFRPDEAACLLALLAAEAELVVIPFTAERDQAND